MPLLLAVALLSAAALGYEILLTRLFSIMFWHHYAAMIISMALLGYGASGTVLTLVRHRLEPRLHLVFAVFAAAFAVTSAGGVVVAGHIPFNPLEILWDARQQAYVLLLYLLLAVPFFCAASCIGLALASPRLAVGLVYRADLVGAGLGALLVLAALFLMPVHDGLRLVTGLGFVAAALAIWPARRAAAGALCVLAVIASFAWPAAWIAPKPSPYKGQSLALQAPGARIIATRSSPLGQLAVVESPMIPFRHAPGMSIRATQEPPPQLGLFTDGGGMTAINRWSGERDALAWLDQQPAALPFHLLRQPRVLILGAGGGSDVLLALYHQARHVDALEINPQLVDLLRVEFAAFAGNVFAHETVRVHVAEARKFVETSVESWEIIHVSLLDSFSASAAGALSLSESTLYTIEAFDAYLSRLAEGGMLAITRWLRVPPRDSLKLLATAADALALRGVDDPGRRLALIRGQTTSTLVIKNGRLSRPDTMAIRRFSAARGFDLAWYPGMQPDEANRYNRLPAPYFHDGARAILGADRARFLGRYKFHLAPATDDRPYFFRFFKWRILPEVLAMRGRAGLGLLEGGYLILAATLVQAVIAGLVLVVLPLRWLRSAPQGQTALDRWRVVVYFAALGLAFLFVEIAFIQRFVLFLGHPLYAIAVVLAAFLVFAGLGSGLAARITRTGKIRPPALAPITLAVSGIMVAAGLYLLVLPHAFAWLSPLPQAGQIAAAILLIAPLAFCMGLPFPLGLDRVKSEAPALVPWAWGINGCASVASPILASLLATHLGFSTVVLLALMLYGIAAAVFRH